jgi:hypothetical protein
VSVSQEETRVASKVGGMRTTSRYTGALMIFLRSLPVALCLCLVGCAASTAAEENAEITATDEAGLSSLPSMLRSQTALERARALDLESGSVSVEYAPSPYDTGAKPLAFEAVTFAADAADEVTVAGDFPSSATVIVTNERFEPLAAARTVRSTTSGLAEANIRLPAGGGGRIVLVRDPKWVKPMTFEVGIRGSGR